ncbi:MAG: DUF2155 domain-containing protein [Paracoccaceae bacterium]
MTLRVALWLGLCALVLPQTATSQGSNDIFIVPLEDANDGQSNAPGTGEIVSEDRRIEAEAATGGVVRALDKVSGETRDVTIETGASARFGRMEVNLGECRYPADNPDGDAFAYLVVRVDGTDGAVFAGWMIASSPALNALDNARYDVWVLRCITS